MPGAGGGDPGRGASDCGAVWVLGFRRVQDACPSICYISSCLLGLIVGIVGPKLRVLFVIVALHKCFNLGNSQNSNINTKALQRGSSE